ncbi:hypothetical protein BaOVIS_018390 [Babesia ovis]|uniref:Uncharacterized protein n=1 Tax=Babesia ovis TaxID=5869 RepID=A0A9W5WUX3_BABOV|nr:hypothetical protein BaOVIS_018390 [Babesia ovis]
MVAKQRKRLSSNDNGGTLVSRIDTILQTGDQGFKLEEGLLLLEECISHYDRLPSMELPMHKIQMLGAHIEDSGVCPEAELVNGFIEKTLSFLLGDTIDVGCNTKHCFDVGLARCLFRRIFFSVLFTLLNSMSRGDRKTAETNLFDKHAPLMEAAVHKLFENLDFEEKISLVELLWRGVRRAGNAKATKAMTKKPRVAFRGIKLLDPKNFEKEAITWLEKNGCLNESYGLYKVGGMHVDNVPYRLIMSYIGRLEVNLSTKQIFEYEFTEVIVAPAMMRAHLAGDQACLKVEVPYAHVVNMSVNNGAVELSFKLLSSCFNIAGLWSIPLQEAVSNLVESDELLIMKMKFPGEIPAQLVDTISAIGKVVNTPLMEELPFAEKAITQNDDTPVFDLDSGSDDENEGEQKETVLPNTLTYATSTHRKVELRLPFDSAISDDYKFIEKLPKRIEFTSSPSSTGYNQASLSLSTELSNSISSCEKPYTDTLLEPSRRAMNLHIESTTEPLMMSLEHYRETKAKELMSIFKRIFREESDQAKAEISKFCAAQEALRRQSQTSYKLEVESLVKEIERNHQELLAQLKKILSEFDALRNNTFGADGHRMEKTRSKDGANPMIANCTGLVETTEAAIREIDEVIERIKTHYAKKKIDCSKALQGL